MIGAGIRWAANSWLDASRIAPSLGLFAGHPAASETRDGLTLSRLARPRGPSPRGWRAVRSPAGNPVLICGWIDNCDRIAADLGVDRASPQGQDEEYLYGAAFDRWGDGAEARISGLYASIIALPDGRLRLARSPLGAYPLFYAHTPTGAVACSIPRPVFAAGWPQKLRSDALLSQLAFELEDDKAASAYDGLMQVPEGSVAYLSPAGVTCRRWYDITAIPPTRFARDEDYVEQANALLAESVGHALAAARKPAVSLSGGLDSSIATAEIVRQLPAGQRLPSFTFHPPDDWQGNVPPTNFADEREYVRAFVAQYPQIDPHFIDNRGIGFDHKAREFFLATSTAYPAQTVGATHHGVWQAAADAGVDWLLTAADGNATISNSAPWAYSEFLLRGRWRELWRMAANRPGDHRSVPRRILAMGLVPLLPPRMRAAVRQFVHRNDDTAHFGNPLLREGPAQGRKDSIVGGPEASSRRQWLAMLEARCGIGAEMGHGYEQIFGLRCRDVTHYRPLLEFCFSLPTDQFVRNGQTRWLARRMAVGRLPEAQRLERRNAMQNADWYARLTPRLGELREMIGDIERDPELAGLIDTARARALVDNWPQSDPGYGKLATHLRFALPSTLLMAQFVRHVSGRN
ncbi:asparagine synthase-related protein [Novosphingobium sp. TH158]|uniref:asparagine synthase-related protein n=1 Tax=Novosphingobium sp. TH158 TaxID=2067455 RepID=UPI000C7DB17D|nr:asparagine synthase-related protein [Novosphingobium sp. TH158]PLK27081.1 hypothetical protein C0V78_09445 [Novosphingobium sp. TH158]